MTPPTERLELPRSPTRSATRLLLKPVQLTQPCELTCCLKSNRPKKLQTSPRQRESKLPQTCSSSTWTFCQFTQCTYGTRSSTSRRHLTHRQTFKTFLRKDPRDFCASHSINSLNVADQEQYYITNMLKKPQWVQFFQFVERMEQLNSYFMQLTCWYYSPSAKSSTIPMNVPFAKADLASHICWMCPHTWQDQFNITRKLWHPWTSVCS